MHRLNLILVHLLALLGGPAALLASAPRGADGPVLVIPQPWGAPAETVVQAAGGRLIGPAQAPIGVIAAGGSPDFAEALRAAGALAVLDAGRLAAFCGGANG